jgi:voltage-gated potassium channel Kch
VLAIDEVEDSLNTAAMVRREFPDLKIYARARDRQHAHRLIDLGVDIVRRELFLASLDMTREVLEGLGIPPEKARQAVDTFLNHDRERLFTEYRLSSDADRMRERALRAHEELEELFRRDLMNDEVSKAS